MGRPKKPPGRKRVRLNVTLHPDVSETFLAHVRRRDEELTQVVEEALIFYLVHKRGLKIDYKGEHVDMPSYIQ